MLKSFGFPEETNIGSYAPLRTWIIQEIDAMHPFAIGLSLAQETVLAVGAIVASLIGIFALDIWIVNMLFLRISKPTLDSWPIKEWPKVSIHLPLYNEEKVVARLIEACLALDYPKKSVEIIIVDDSVDKTTEIVRVYEKKYMNQIRVVHRLQRTGFKGGALSEALKRTTSDYIAIFDADNVPPREFLKTMLPRLMSDPRLAFVEARRSHINSESSWISKGISFGLDIYGYVDQRVRSSADLLAHFSGSGGIFRRNAIEEVGGWTGDTLAEDLDLSVRLKLAGWKYSCKTSLTSLGEVPSTLRSARGQQSRWAKGYTECLRKHFFPILRSKRLSMFQKVEALIHLGMYLIFPLTLIGTIFAALQYIVFPLPVLIFGLWIKPVALFLFATSLMIMTAPLASALLTIREMGGRKFSRLFRLVYMSALLYGLLLTNTCAVIEALLGKKSVFYRTPKVGDLSVLGPRELPPPSSVAS